MSGLSLVHPDITLLLDLEGVIQNVTLSNAISDEGVAAWRGRPWTETVGERGSEKVSRMVQDARTTGVSAYRQVTQRFPGGLELPIEYTTVRLGDNGGLLAIGRSLQAVAELQSRLIAAQQAMEQDYWKLREVETRYRLLFDASNEAVLLIRVDNLRVVEANPAAIRALGLARGRDFLPELLAHEREPFQTMLGRVRDQGRAPGALVHLGAEKTPFTIRASLMTAEPGPVFMLQIAPLGAALPQLGQPDALPIDALIDRLPDGFAVVDEDGFIRRANQGFIDLAQVSTEAQVLGERLGRWLQRPGADMSVLMANLGRHGVVRRFATTLYGELGTEIEVEISAASNTLPAGAGHNHANTPRGRMIAVMIRDVGRRANAPDFAGNLRDSLAAVVEQIGKTPLPKLVRDTVGAVERHCIEAALELAEGNRTATAEILGVSRQSLYEKLNRYDIEGSARTVPGERTH